MEEKIAPWNPKRVAASILTAVILIFGIVPVLNRMGDVRLYATLVVGAILGAWYVIWGDLPERVYDATQSRWNLVGLDLTRPDDPRNISPKVYLPLILVAILAGIIAFIVAVR